MFPEISDDNDEGNQVIERVGRHRNQQVRGEIGGDKSGEVEPEKCGQHGVDRRDRVGKSEEQIADQHGQKRIPVLNPQIQKAAKEGFFADARQNCQQNYVEPPAFAQIRSDGISDELANLHKSFGTRDHTDGQKNQHRPGRQNSQTKILHGPGQGRQRRATGEPSAKECHKQNCAFEDSCAGQELRLSEGRFVIGNGADPLWLSLCQSLIAGFVRLNLTPQTTVDGLRVDLDMSYQPELRSV